MKISQQVSVQKHDLIGQAWNRQETVQSGVDSGSRVFLFVGWHSWGLPSLELTVCPWKQARPQKEIHLASIDFQGAMFSFRQGTFLKCLRVCLFFSVSLSVGLLLLFTLYLDPWCRNEMNAHDSVWLIKSGAFKIDVHLYMDKNMVMFQSGIVFGICSGQPFVCSTLLWAPL